MVSYFKTQWLRIIFGVIGLVVAVLCLSKPDGELAALLWFIAGLLNFVMSYINWHHDRIELLEKKAEKYDALCELVNELVEADRVYKELEKVQDAKIKRLKEKLK